jgi:hypothetical protein
MGKLIISMTPQQPSYRWDGRNCDVYCSPEYVRGALEDIERRLLDETYTHYPEIHASILASKAELQQALAVWEGRGIEHARKMVSATHPDHGGTCEAFKSAMQHLEEVRRGA